MQRSLQKFERDAKLTEARTGIERTTAAVQKLSYEFGSVIRLFGAGSIVGGGVVASLVLMGKSLGDFAQKGLQLHYAAREIGVTTEFLNKFSKALQGVGLT